MAAQAARAASMGPVINATGVLLHTNLGRAPLSGAARDAVAAAAGCTDLEFDLAAGVRGRRGGAGNRVADPSAPLAGDWVISPGLAATPAGRPRRSPRTLLPTRWRRDCPPGPLRPRLACLIAAWPRP